MSKRNILVWSIRSTPFSMKKSFGENWQKMHNYANLCKTMHVPTFFLVSSLHAIMRKVCVNFSGWPRAPDNPLNWNGPLKVSLKYPDFGHCPWKILENPSEILLQEALFVKCYCYYVHVLGVFALHIFHVQMSWVLKILISIFLSKDLDTNQPTIKSAAEVIN